MFVRLLLASIFFVAVFVAFAFMMLPVVGIFVHSPPGKLIDQISSKAVIDALIISLKAVFAAQIVILLVGTPTAYFLATRRFPGRSFLVALVELPIVLPPAVAGIGLFTAFGPLGLLGGTFRFLHFNVSFNLTAVVFAVMLVSGPFYIRQGIAAFEAIDGNLVAASRTLGAGSMRTFFRVALPLARGGLAAGEAICLARGLGEFGATIMFAGSLPGKTETLPVAVYTAFESQGGLDTALAMSSLLIAMSLAILLLLKVKLPWRHSRPSSASPFVRFGSS